MGEFSATAIQLEITVVGCQHNKNNCESYMGDCDYFELGFLPEPYNAYSTHPMGALAVYAKNSRGQGKIGYIPNDDLTTLFSCFQNRELAEHYLKQQNPFGFTILEARFMANDVLQWIRLEIELSR